MHLRTDIDGELVIIPKIIAQKYGAVCLDASSPPGYYIKRGLCVCVCKLQLGMLMSIPLCIILEIPDTLSQ